MASGTCRSVSVFFEIGGFFEVVVVYCCRNTTVVLMVLSRQAVDRGADYCLSGRDCQPYELSIDSCPTARVLLWTPKHGILSTRARVQPLMGLAAGHGYAVFGLHDSCLPAAQPVSRARPSFDVRSLKLDAVNSFHFFCRSQSFQGTFAFLPCRLLRVTELLTASLCTTWPGETQPCKDSFWLLASLTHILLKPQLLIKQPTQLL
jgi:hypothetical protein